MSHSDDQIEPKVWLDHFWGPNTMKDKCSEKIEIFNRFSITLRAVHVHLRVI